MGQPLITRQPAETAGLTGIGPHAVPIEFKIPANFVGGVDVQPYVHDTAAPKTLRLGYRAHVWISAGAIVGTPDVFGLYRETDWLGVADPTFSVEDEDIKIHFGGIVGAAVDAATVTSGVQT